MSGGWKTLELVGLRKLRLRRSLDIGGPILAGNAEALELFNNAVASLPFAELLGGRRLPRTLTLGQGPRLLGSSAHGPILTHWIAPAKGPSESWNQKRALTIPWRTTLYSGPASRRSESAARGLPSAGEERGLARPPPDHDAAEEWSRAG